MTELIFKIHAEEVVDGNFDNSFEVHVLIGLLQKLYIVEFFNSTGT